MKCLPDLLFLKTTNTTMKIVIMTTTTRPEQAMPMIAPNPKVLGPVVYIYIYSVKNLSWVSLTHISSGWHPIAKLWGPVQIWEHYQYIYHAHAHMCPPKFPVFPKRIFLVFLCNPQGAKYVYVNKSNVNRVDTEISTWLRESELEDSL